MAWMTVRRSSRELLISWLATLAIVVACSETEYDAGTQNGNTVGGRNSAKGGAGSTSVGGTDNGGTENGGGRAGASTTGGSTAAKGGDSSAGGHTETSGGKSGTGGASTGGSSIGSSPATGGNGGEAGATGAVGGRSPGGAGGTNSGGQSSEEGGSQAGGTTSNAGGVSPGGMTGEGGGTANVGGGEVGGNTVGQGGVGGDTVGQGGAAGATDPNGIQRFLLRDEGMRTLSYVDLNAPANNWYVRVEGEAGPGETGEQGRDMQLVGGDRVMVGTPAGYEEYAIATGERLVVVDGFPGTMSAHRLRTGNTILSSVVSANIVLTEIDADLAVVDSFQYPGSYVRLVRPTPEGTFLVASNTNIIEGDREGNVLRSFAIDTTETANPHVWKALRRSDGTTVVAEGFGARLRVYDAEGLAIQTITAPNRVNPHFFADFQILANGNYVVTNWQAHGVDHGDEGIQLLVFHPTTSVLLWSWTQDATHFSSLQGVIVLDGLDTSQLHVEDVDGTMTPVG